jgi:hypothetical protein
MELFNYYYNGIRVTKEVFFSLKNLEKLVVNYFDKATSSQRDYRDWPLIKYNRNSDKKN